MTKAFFVQQRSNPRHNENEMQNNQEFPCKFRFTLAFSAVFIYRKIFPPFNRHKNFSFFSEPDPPPWQMYSPIGIRSVHCISLH